VNISDKEAGATVGEQTIVARNGHKKAKLRDKVGVGMYVKCVFMRNRRGLGTRSGSHQTTKRQHATRPIQSKCQGLTLKSRS
jgi:hypothetical protein